MTEAEARRIVDELLHDLDGRDGFEVPFHDHITMKMWRDDWVAIILRGVEP